MVYLMINLRVPFDRELGYVDGLALNSYFFNSALLPVTNGSVRYIDCAGDETSMAQCP